jgi:hypothetical protein
MDNTTKHILSDSSSCFRATPVPCLNRIISIENIENTPQESSKLSTAHRKTAFILSESIQTLGDRFGVNHLGFLTLTFSDHVTCHKEASKRFNSLASNILKTRYLEYVGCVERMKNSRIHFHILVVLKQDIRTGVCFDQFKDGFYNSAPASLKSEWRYWRSTARKYRFGRTELLPVRSTIEGIAKYVGKYIAKNIESRLPEDKGARLVRYSKGSKAGNNRFMFHSEGSSEWRRKVAIFVEILKHRYPDETIEELTDISRLIGKRWAYRNREYILSLP